MVDTGDERGACDDAAGRRRDGVDAAWGRCGGDAARDGCGGGGGGRDGSGGDARGSGSWGVTAGARVWIGGHDVDARRVVVGRLPVVQRPPVGCIDVAIVTPVSCEEWAYFAGKVVHRVARGGSVWVVFRDVAGGAPGMGEAALAAAVAGVGLVPVERAGVTAVYSSIRFVRGRVGSGFAG
ncbi:MAG: hypothetical protein ACE5E6_02665 [Phycisphaerae bacterium]